MPSVKESVRDRVIARSVSSQTDRACGDRSDTWFGRPSVKIISDPNVKAEEFRLYCLLSAYVFSGNIARVGQRRLAQILGHSQSFISDHIKALIRTGWISRADFNSKNGQRTDYILNSAVFKPDAEPASASALVCTKCQQFKRNLPITSVCRECVKLAHDRKRMEYALQTLGKNATDHELAAFCEIDKLTPRWRKIRRDVMGVDKDVS
jgi:hypothetical protein